MAITVISTDVSGVGTRLTLSDDGDVIVARSGVVVSDSAFGILGLGSNHSVLIEGTAGGNTGISLGDQAALDQYAHVTVAPTGVVMGIYAAIEVRGIDQRIENLGFLTGDTYGILSYGMGAGLSQILNDGRIVSGYAGIMRLGTEAVVIENAGLIRGNSASIAFSPVSAPDGAVTILNRGMLDGAVRLGDGADFVDTRQGQLIGQVFLNGGNDRAFGSAADDELFGGTGADSLSGEAGNDYLDGGAGRDRLAGGAGDDTYVVDLTSDVVIELAGGGIDLLLLYANDTLADHVENALNVGGGALAITGNALANRLEGSGGNDTLNGAGGGDRLLGNWGADRLRGGGGADRLYGGGGNDAFVFTARAEGGDIIADFHNTAGDNDGFRLAAAAFGGLPTGVLAAGRFVTRLADNLAQDANDRFVFRQSDATLWFDANGNAAGGLTMIADLQDSAAVTAADIVLF